MKGFGPWNGISPFKTLFSNLPSGLKINKTKQRKLNFRWFRVLQLPTVF